MFVCSRCGSSYNARHIGVEHCPRCRLRDKVDSPLAFKAFDLSKIELSRPRVGGAAEASGRDAGTGAASTAISSSAS